MIRMLSSSCLAVVLLAGCVATSPMRSDETLGPDEGVVVTTVTTNWPLANPLYGSLKLTFSAAGSLGASLSVGRSPDFQAVKLKAGQYRWTSVSAGNRVLELSRDTGFQVAAGKVTYIGDIDVQFPENWTRLGTGRISVTDNAQASRNRLSAEYPALAQNLDFQTMLTEFRPGKRQ